ncbi:MAG: hypothetical protein KAW47_04790, partial [Thermoplasmatales archaeon]|nr:hypothetical protein [Thermoplasmatales archaeon]
MKKKESVFFTSFYFTFAFFTFAPSGIRTAHQTLRKFDQNRFAGTPFTHISALPHRFFSSLILRFISSLKSSTFFINVFINKTIFYGNDTYINISDS